ncbi:hypothetical protein LJC48_06165 [Desulfovibrio sp. OttesenSCG-928-C06]|nr:hypothetical protein [Desulfovibrio sp. OttesenSCG-928-C06]
MSRVHPAAWVGLVINLGLMIYGINYVTDSYYLDTVDTVFLLLFIGGGLLSVAGVIMLAMGSPAGGIVGAIGSVIFVPIGMVCAIGCMISRNRMKLGHYEQTDLQRAQEIVNRMENTSAAKTMPLDSVSVALTPDAQTDAGSSAMSAQGSAGVSAQSAAVLYGVSAQSTQSADGTDPAATTDRASAPGYGASVFSAAPKVSFPFYDQRLIFVILLVVCVVAFFVLMNSFMVIPGQLVLPMLICVFFLIMNSRVLKWSVFSFYDDYMECVPGLYASPLRINFNSIARADVTRGRARLHVRRPDGGEDKITVPFGFVRGALREEARTVFRAKMQELGVLESR